MNIEKLNLNDKSLPLNRNPLPAACIKGRRILTVFQIEGSDNYVYNTLGAAIRKAETLSHLRRLE